MLMSTPEFCCQCLCPHSESQPPSPLKETLQYQQVGLDQSLTGSLLFSPGSWCTWVLVCGLQGWSFCFLQSCVIPVIKPYWHAKPDSLAAPLPIARPPGWEA